MKKGIISTLTSFIAVLCITNGTFSAHLLGFLMVGAIPGTTVTVPFWAMLAFYCLVITVIVTLYVEGMFAFMKSGKLANPKKTRLPKRRYNTI